MSAPAVAFLRHTQALTRDGFCCTHTHVQVKRREGMLWWSKLVDVELAGVCSLCHRELERKLWSGAVQLTGNFREKQCP